MDILAKAINNSHQLLTLTRQGEYLAALKILFEFFVIIYCLIWVFSRIRGTQAARLFKGLIVFAVIYLLSSLLELTLITSILQQIVPVAVMAFLIIFQPEIRRGLGYLGRTTSFKFDLLPANNQKDRNAYIIKQIIAACRELARSKTGALIVVEPPEGQREYLSPGTAINADVSTNLLLSIFFPNSPLHDGAAIIRADKVMAAGVILRMTDNPNLSYRYGTRHRAAIGLSEMYDGLCVVISEETGSISAASHGMLVQYNSADELQDPLSYIYESDFQGKLSSPLHSFLSHFGYNKKASTTGEAEKS